MSSYTFEDDCHCVWEPDEPWGYEIDDWGIEHTSDDPLWPWRRRRNLKLEPQRASLRLAPDCAFQAWRTQYVLLHPSEGDTLSFDMDLAVRGQEKFNTVTAVVEIDLRTLQVTVPPHDVYRAAVLAKVNKVAEFIRKGRELAAAGQPPFTAHERYEANKPPQEPLMRMGNRRQ